MHSLNTLILSYIDRHAALGAAVAILQRGEIVYTGGFGTTCVEEHGVAVTPRTLFSYGSICKTICATLIMRLVEQGHLALDRPIVEYLPDFQFSRADYGGRVTLRHLLSHTSGLPMSGKYWGPRDPDSLRRFVYEQIPHYTFLSEPGAVHLYSNTVICIAGHVAEAVTGKYYDDLVQEYVFDPLQMDRATFDPAIAMTYPLALPHERGPDGELHVIHRMTYNVSGNPSSFALGSVLDLAQLAQVFLNEGSIGGQAFLSAASVAEMHRQHASCSIQSAASAWSHINDGYGLGFNVGHYKGRRAARHGGMNLTYNCFFDLFPDDQAGVILLTNQCEDRLLMELVAALYDEALGLPQQGMVYIAPPPTLATPPTAAQLQRYTGTFLSVEMGVLATFTIADTALILERHGEKQPLISIGDGQFYAAISEPHRVSVAFVEGAGRSIIHTMIGGEPYHPIAINPALKPIIELWQSFAGRYKDPSNASRDDILTVRLHDGVLFIAEGTNEAPCTPIGERSFLNTLGLFEFEELPEQRPVLVWGKAARYYPI